MNMFEYEKPVAELIDLLPIEEITLSLEDGGDEEWDEEW